MLGLDTWITVLGGIVTGLITGWFGFRQIQAQNKPTLAEALRAEQTELRKELRDELHTAQSKEELCQKELIKTKTVMLHLLSDLKSTGQDFPSIEKANILLAGDN